MVASWTPPAFRTVHSAWTNHGADGSCSAGCCLVPYWRDEILPHPLSTEAGLTPMSDSQTNPDSEIVAAVIEVVLHGRAMTALASMKHYYSGIRAGHHTRVAQAVYCGFLMVRRAMSDECYREEVVRCCNARGIAAVRENELPFNVMLVATTPEDEHDRQLASKYGRAIDVLLFDKCSPEQALERLRKEGIASLASLAAFKVPRRVRRKPRAADGPGPDGGLTPGASGQPAGGSAPVGGSTGKPDTVLDSDSPDVEPVNSTEVEAPTVPGDNCVDDWLSDDGGFESEITVAVPGNIFDELFTDGRAAVEAIITGAVATAAGSQTHWHVTKARKARNTTGKGG